MKKECSFKGCDKKAEYKGLCPAHYQQQRQGKELKPLQTQYHGLTEEQRFLKWTDVKGKDDCWLWKGSTIREGWHGQWRNKDGRIELAHRASFRLFRCEIPSGICVLHHCDNPICVNPTHLFLGTQSDNSLDMWRKARARPGVSRGEKHGNSKLTAEAVIDIRLSDMTVKEMADKYSVSPTTIGDIRKRKTWTHLD